MVARRQHLLGSRVVAAWHEHAWLAPRMRLAHSFLFLSAQHRECQGGCFSCNLSMVQHHTGSLSTLKRARHAMALGLSSFGAPTRLPAGAFAAWRQVLHGARTEQSQTEKAVLK
jgi:hypothetical protein